MSCCQRLPDIFNLMGRGCVYVIGITQLSSSVILAASQLVYTHKRVASRPSTHPDTDAVGQSRGPDTSIVHRPPSLRPPQCGIALSEELLGASALLVGGYTGLFTPQGNKFTLPWANTRDSG